MFSLVYSWFGRHVKYPNGLIMGDYMETRRKQLGIEKRDKYKEKHVLEQMKTEEGAASSVKNIE